MMDYNFMESMMVGNFGWMMFGMWVSWILFVTLSVLGILALIKYLKK